MGRAFDQLPKNGANTGEWRSAWAFKRKDDGAARVSEKLQSKKEKLSEAARTKTGRGISEAFDALYAMVERPDAMIMLVELLKQSGFTPEQILQKINAMSTPNDDENKKLNWNGSGAAAEDEEPNMPPQQPNKMSMQQPSMQQMEDPNRISARTNQSRGPTQQQTFGREVQGPGPVDAQMPEEMKHHPGQAFGIPGPAGAEPGTQAPSTQLNGSNVNGKFASLIALLDALEAAERNGEELDDDLDSDQILGQGAPKMTGVYHDQQPPPRPSPMRRELSPTPVNGDSVAEFLLRAGRM